MIKKLKNERNLLLSMVIVCLIGLIISGLSEQTAYAEIETLKGEAFILRHENGMLRRRNEDLFVETDILSRRIWTIENQIEQAKMYDIPLSEELQEYTYNLCKENNLDYELILAIMDQESDFREDVVSRTYDYGIMQINAVNHDWLRVALSIEDFLDAKQNILAGVFILQGLSEKYEDAHKVLMAYNMGEYGAQKKWEQGILESNYSKLIVERADELKREK